MISKELKCEVNEVEELFSNTNEDYLRIKFCLENIKKNEIKSILITLTNSFERKTFENLAETNFLTN